MIQDKILKNQEPKIKSNETPKGQARKKTNTGILIILGLLVLNSILIAQDRRYVGKVQKRYSLI